MDEVAAKVSRAEEHLHALDAEIRRFATQKPYAFHVVTQKRSDEVRDVVWLRGIPPRWPAIIGDCVHNLRSALDHLVWALSGGDGVAPNHSEFPVFADERQYSAVTRQGRPARGSGLSKIEGVRDDNARARITALQPFSAPSPLRHPLWVLHELDRVDKHRALHIVIGWAYTTNLHGHRIRSTKDLPPGWHRITATSSPEYPAQMPGAGQTRVKVRSDLAMRVALGAEVVHADENVDVLLRELLDFVRTQVITSLSVWL